MTMMVVPYFFKANRRWCCNFWKKTCHVLPWKSIIKKLGFMLTWESIIVNVTFLDSMDSWIFGDIHGLMNHARWKASLIISIEMVTSAEIYLCWPGPPSRWIKSSQLSDWNSMIVVIIIGAFQTTQKVI